jgi:hypothetical protein
MEAMAELLSYGYRRVWTLLTASVRGNTTACGKRQTGISRHARAWLAAGKKTGCTIDPAGT